MESQLTALVQVTRAMFSQPVCLEKIKAECADELKTLSDKLHKIMVSIIISKI